MGAKNRQKNLHKRPGPTFQIRPGPEYFYLVIFDEISKFYLKFLAYLVASKSEVISSYEPERVGRFKNSWLLYLHTYLTVYLWKKAIFFFVRHRM